MNGHVIRECPLGKRNRPMEEMEGISDPGVTADERTARHLEEWAEISLQKNQGARPANGDRRRCPPQRKGKPFRERHTIRLPGQKRYSIHQHRAKEAKNKRSPKVGESPTYDQKAPTRHYH